MKTYLLKLTEDLHKKAKSKAVLKDISLNELIEEALIAYLKRIDNENKR